MSRLVVVTVLGLLLVPAAAFAAPAPSASPTAAAQSSAQDGGVIEGKVTNVDYARGIVTVDSTRQGKVDVATMPTTSVQSDDPGYHTLTDVSKGSKVQIFISKTAGKLVAQIIRLIKH
jgi:Cu/Ag efflux protein CusF